MDNPLDRVFSMKTSGLLLVLTLFLLSACGGGGSSTPPDLTAPVITITGSETINHEQGTTYTDEGATATDAIDGSVEVSTSGSVDAEAGTYTLTYSATDSAGNTATETRTVIVADTIAPVITLSGDDTITLQVGDTFTDAGATATDDVDGDLTASIVVTGSVDTSADGTSILAYNVTDAAGNTATEVTRTVTVIQSANGIWQVEISDDGIDTELLGIFNEGKFALAALTVSEEPVSECFVSFEVNSGILYYTESCEETQYDAIPLALDTCLDIKNESYSGFGYRYNLIVSYDSSTNSITVDNYDDANCQQYANSFSRSETETVESVAGNIMAGTYSIQGDQLETDSAKLYGLNDAFIEDRSGTAVIASASTMMLTAKDAFGNTALDATLLYDDLNNQQVSIDALAGTWEIADSSCFGSVNFNSCLLSITDTGDISLNTTDCALEGTISQTTSNNIMALATSITGDNCASAGQYTGFTVYGVDVDDDGESNEEIVVLMSNEQSGFGYPMQKQQ
jgi:hypothetical protein